MRTKQHYFIGKRILALLIILLVTGWLSQRFFFRLDLTEDGRYTLSENTKSFLSGLDKTYYCEIYLKGEIQHDLKKLRQAVEEMLDELNRYTKKGNILFEFVEFDETDPEEVEALVERGLKYTSVNVKDKNGKMTQELLFPGLILHDKNREIAVNFLQTDRSKSGQENLQSSMESLEYELTLALRMLQNRQPKKIGFLTGQGELDEWHTWDFSRSLAGMYNVARVTHTELKEQDVVIVAQPRKDFTEEVKYQLDQYVMRGGKLLWLVDEVVVSKDSLRENREATAFYEPLNIEDQLFTYGVRVNPELVLDGNGDLIPVNTALPGEQANYTPVPWYYEPLLETNPFHPITKGVALVKGEFVNSLDTIQNEIEKTILLRTSGPSRLEQVPRIVDMSVLQKAQEPNFFFAPPRAVAVLLEGSFTSVFSGRLKYTGRANFKATSVPSKMIVVGDGDLIKNEMRGVGENRQYFPLGFNSHYQRVHGNKLFLLNAVDYLCDDEGWMELRSREMPLRLLNKKEVRTNRAYWQFVNTAIPILLVVCFGLIFNLYRRRKYRK